MKRIIQPVAVLFSTLLLQNVFAIGTSYTGDLDDYYWKYHFTVYREASYRYAILHSCIPKYQSVKTLNVRDKYFWVETLSNGEEYVPWNDIPLTIIDASAFSTCYYVEKIVIPQGVESIGDEAFKNCYSLEEIEFPNSLTHLGSRAFANCSNLKTIRIPKNLTVWPSSFDLCDGLEAFVVDDSSGYSVHDGMLLLGSSLERCPEGKRSANIPNSIVSISDTWGDFSAFKFCYKLVEFSVNEDHPAFSVCNVGRPWGWCLIASLTLEGKRLHIAASRIWCYRMA